MAMDKVICNGKRSLHQEVNFKQREEYYFYNKLIKLHLKKLEASQWDHEN